MATYNLHTETSRILQDVLIASPALNMLPSIKEAAKKVKFTGGGDGRPFLPTPMKMTESSSALNALVAASASAAATDRYGIGLQNIEVNTDLATLFLESVLLPTINGKPFNSDPKMQEELSRMELHDQTSLVRRHATGIYQTKDGRWYQLHSSMNADPIMEMMGVTNQDVTREEAVKIWSEKVAQWDSAEIEKVANEKYRQAGAVCYTPEEFFSSEQGRIMGEEPLWTTRPIAGGGKAWPKPAGNPADYKPLAGVRVIDFSRVIAAPAISKKLAVLGADVIRISHSGNPDYAATMIDLQTGKRDADLNVKTPEGKQAFIELLKGADVLVDGFRPGALERLGFTSESLREINPSLIYVRENCYGFKGPISYRSGWQQVSDCLVGISYLQGKFLGLEEAVLPLFPNSDYQTGLVGAAAVVQALLARTKEDETFDIDVSLTQYNIWFYRLGLQSEAVQRSLREMHKGLELRHDQDVLEGVVRTHSSVLKARPDLVQPEYFWEMDGSEWNLDTPIKVLAPAFKLSKSKLEYTVPSGCRGRNAAEWL